MVGVIIHVVGTLITKRVEAGTGRASDWWRTRTAAQRERRKKRIEQLLTDPDEEILVGQHAIYSLMGSGTVPTVFPVSNVVTVE